jgi:hypothetical protein
VIYPYTQTLNGGGFVPTGASDLGAAGSFGLTLGMAPGTAMMSDLQSAPLSPGLIGGVNGSNPQGVTNWPIFNTTTTSTNINTGLVNGNGRAAFVRT